jgi:uncharacterized LabA/DUF88 family protein
MTAIKHKEQRVVVLIDVQNLYYSARNLYKSKVNFQEILKVAVSGRKLIRAVAYVVQTEAGEEKAFFDALSYLGIEPKIKELQVYYSGAKKADWDVGITIDAIRFSSLADTIVLVSGDGDFFPLVEYLKNQGRQVEVIAFGRSTSSRLKEIADDFIDLDKNPKKYLLKKGITWKIKRIL